MKKWAKMFSGILTVGYGLNSNSTWINFTFQRSGLIKEVASTHGQRPNRLNPPSISHLGNQVGKYYYRYYIIIDIFRRITTAFYATHRCCSRCVQNYVLFLFCGNANSLRYCIVSISSSYGVRFSCLLYQYFYCVLCV